MKKKNNGNEVKLIAFTGGPCAGKSTLMTRAIEWLSERGVKALVLSETATEFINAGFSPRNFSYGMFEKHLIRYSLLREDAYIKILEDIGDEMPRVLLCDRGILDASAYVYKYEFEEILFELGLNIHKLRERYASVIHLVTAANGAEKSYTCANNTARKETIEEARAIDLKTQKAWYGHQHFFVVDNSTSFEKKIHRALSFIARTINMPEPLEIERKFIVTNFKKSFIPKDAVVADIVQNYLTIPDGVWRVRKRTIDGSSSYYVTQKKIPKK